MKIHSLLLFSVLSLPAVSAVPAAQDIGPGFQVNPLSYPTGAAIRRLTDGTLLTNNGNQVQRWSTIGVLQSTLGNFGVSGTPGAMVVDPSETFLLVGNSDTGEMLKVNLDGSGQTTMGTVLSNHDASFEDAVNAIVSSDGCGTNCVNLVRVDTNTGTATPIATLDGDVGPVAFDSAGDLFYARNSQGTPVGGTSLVRFDQATLQNPPGKVFQEENGLLVIEVESAPPNGDWNVETTFPGYTGASYYRWEGPNLFSTPGVDPLTYEINIQNPGHFEFHIHNRHEDPNPDQDNDCWVRVDNSPWTKCYSNMGASTVGVWNWESVFEDASGHYQAYYNLSAGQHTLQISGRSNGYAADRIIMFRSFANDPYNLSNPESPTAGFGLTDGTTVASGLDGAGEMIYEPDLDEFILAENNVVSGNSRLIGLSKTGAVTPYVTGNFLDQFFHLSYVPQNGPGAFLPYQPSGTGQASYVRGGIGVSEHMLLEPQRPNLTLSGPGSQTGTGQLNVDIDDTYPGAIIVMYWVPTSLLSPVEDAIVLPGLTPIVSPMTAFGKPTGLPLVADGNGSAGFGLNITLGVTGTVALQAVTVDLAGPAIAMSDTEIL